MSSELFNVFELQGELSPKIPGHILVLSQTAPESLREQADLERVFQNLGHDGGRVPIVEVFTLPTSSVPGEVDDILFSDDVVEMKYADRLANNDLILRLFPRIRFSPEARNALTPVVSGKVLFGQSDELVTCRGVERVGHPVLVAEEMLKNLAYSIHITFDPDVLCIHGGLLDYIFSHDPAKPDGLMTMMRAVCNEQLISVASREFVSPLIDTCVDVFTEWHREDKLDELVSGGILVWVGDRYELAKDKIEVNAYSCYQRDDGCSMTRLPSTARKQLSRILFPRAEILDSGGTVHQDRFRSKN